MGKLDGKVAVVTGSTSGMGRATAILFAREGAKVMVTGRNEERAKAVVNQIKKEGFIADYVIVDMTDIKSVRNIIDKTEEVFGAVDILFNNAGMLSITPLMDISLQEWEDTFRVDVTAPLLLTQMVAPKMKSKGKGIIINTCSIAGANAHFGYVAYIASKHAMAGLTKSMAWELGPEIRVNGIMPGAINTAMLDSVGGVAAADSLVQGSPLKTYGEPEDIANAALFLATDESKFIDGQLIRVDGGIEI